MTQYITTVEIVTEGDFLPNARNRVLRVLAKAELDATIVRFEVGATRPKMGPPGSPLKDQ